MPDKINMLLVEDNYSMHELFSTIFIGIVRTLDTAITLKAAIDYLKSQSLYDIIMLDLMLPDSKGIDTLREIIKIRPDVPILVLTGAGSELMEEAFSLGAEDFIIKGSNISKSELISSVLKSVWRSRARKVLSPISKAIVKVEETIKKLEEVMPKP